MKSPGLALCAVALATVLAACSATTEPSVSTTPTSSAPDAITAPEREETTANTKTSADSLNGYVDPLDEYIEMGYGMSLPANGPGDCEGPTYIYIATTEGKTVTEVLRPENLVDMGPREFAQGETDYDDQGRIATYTVASGDVLGVIADRLCIYGAGGIRTLNGHKGYEPIHPGEVLVINPDAVPDFEFHDPYR